MSRAVTARFPGHRRLPVRVKCRLPTQKGCVKVCDLLLHAGSECHRKERGPGLSARLRLPPKPGARGRSLRPLGNAPGSLAPARTPLRAVSVPRATVTHRGAAGTAFSDSRLLPARAAGASAPPSAPVRPWALPSLPRAHLSSLCVAPSRSRVRLVEDGARADLPQLRRGAGRGDAAGPVAPGQLRLRLRLRPHPVTRARRG